MDITYEKRTSWLDRPLLTSLTLSGETILFMLLLIVGFASRFYDLGARVISHDETIHVYHNSWSLYRGNGYHHDPLSHGPLQFHFIALSYFLFGDSDFTARIPAALFSIASIAFVWNYRRYLGRTGWLAAAVLMLISPYMLYYGRYVRNEALVAFFGIVALWAILRYLETGQARYTFWLIAATSLHFTAKETAFIYTAQALIFLALYLIYRVSQNRWADPAKRNTFLIVLMVALVLIGVAGGVGLLNRSASNLSGTETAAPAVPGQGLAPGAAGGVAGLPLVLAGLAVVALMVALYYLIRGYTWSRLRGERSFALMVLLGTMVLPMLAPFPVKLLGLDPINYNSTQTLTVSAIFIAILALAAIAIGLLWNPRLWLINAAIFYSIFVLFYTTVFTNGFGIFTGLAGALGYWLAQQSVNRGSQPWYYYILIQIPVYEYLPALGSLLALGIAGRRWLLGYQDRAPSTAEEGEGPAEESPQTEEQPPVVALLGFWSITSILAYTLAGEKMPWLTVHIAWPMILLAGWGIGCLIESIDWSVFLQRRGWLVVSLLPVLLVSALIALGSLLGNQPPFQGKELEQLRATTTFVTALVVAVASGIGLYYVARPWPSPQLNRIITLFFLAFLGVLTARTAIRAAYINYDNATEFLVYAHGASGDKEALAQIEEISRRTTDGLALHVAYDNETAYPFFWYLRNYPNAQYYGENPTRSLREDPVILVSNQNYTKIEPVVGQAYYSFDYIRLWWPNQDYFDLTGQRILDTLRSPQMRTAIFQIWFNRDYKLYGQLLNKDMSLPNWSPSAHMRLYIRKDIVSQLWNYGTAASPEQAVADPYEGKQVKLSADQVIGALGQEAGQFNRPRGVAVAPDGSLYVADTENHRIQHLAADGSVLQVWGSFADIATGQAPGGTLNQPWDIAVGPDGSVYVADTWNYRIQKFTADGKFITMWGYSGQAEKPDAFWGPRGIAVDSKGRVFVADTGNKRVVVFDSDGNSITQFGSQGLSPGQFDEPVGLSLDDQGNLYVADTWNQRIQVFSESQDGTFQPLRSWDVAAWYGQSLDNKPYLAVDDQGHVFATDPEGYRVLEFTGQGEFLRFWGDVGTGPDSFGLVGAVAADHQGGVWVTDTDNSRLMHFIPPEK